MALVGVLFSGWRPLLRTKVCWELEGGGFPALPEKKPYILHECAKTKIENRVARWGHRESKEHRCLGPKVFLNRRDK